MSVVAVDVGTTGVRVSFLPNRFLETLTVSTMTFGAVVLMA